MGGKAGGRRGKGGGSVYLQIFCCFLVNLFNKSHLPASGFTRDTKKNGSWYVFIAANVRKLHTRF